MADNSLRKLGGICSIFLGVLYVLINVTILLMPPEQRMTNDPARFWSALAQNPRPTLLLSWEFVLVAVLAFAALPAISDIVRSINEGWVRWVSNLAYLGFALIAITNLRSAALLPQIAATFMAGDTMTKAALIAVYSPPSSLNLDPQGWLEFGGVGVWILLVSTLALRRVLLPAYLSYMGIALAILYWARVAGGVIQNNILIAIGGGLGGFIAAPIWYIWIGLACRRGRS